MNAVLELLSGYGGVRHTHRHTHAEHMTACVQPGTMYPRSTIVRVTYDGLVVEYNTNVTVRYIVYYTVYYVNAESIMTMPLS